MNSNEKDAALNAPEYKESTGSDVPSTPPAKEGDVEHIGTSPVVDAATEAKVLRKLDIRIIPMICWIYLNNFMDRGTSGAFACKYYLTV
jgi:hypothetical protein